MKKLFSVINFLTCIKKLMFQVCSILFSTLSPFITGLPPHRSAKQTTFLNVWRRYCPFVITSRPKTDLCWQCQKNNSAVYQSANLTEEDKLGRIQTQTEHLAHVAVERNLYRDMVLDSQAAVKEGRDGE